MKIKSQHIFKLLLLLLTINSANTNAQQCLYPTDFEWYIDNDGDGEGNLYNPVTTDPCQYCVVLELAYQSAGQKGARCTINSQDCNDADPTINAKTIFYLDGDGDGYYTETWRREDQCLSCGDAALELYKCRDTRWRTVEGPPKNIAYNAISYGNNSWTWSLKGLGDCNDSNPFINPATVWYQDNDLDGWYLNTKVSCTKPGAGWYHIGEDLFPTGSHKGYIAFNVGDCNDNDGAIYQELTVYPDKDGDGYRSSETGITSCTSTPPAGYTIYTYDKKELDCDDNNAAIWRSATFYKDDDKDWFLIGPYTICYGANEPAGYLASGTNSRGVDCNDNDYILRGSIPALVDADNDGYAASLTPVDVCAGNNGNVYVPAGYMLIADNKGLDCNDNDANLQISTTYYKDADADGYPPIGYDSVSACAAPAGYSSIFNFKLYGSIDYDCDDADANAHLGRTVYLDADGDGIPANTNPLQVCNSGFLPAGYSDNFMPAVIRNKVTDIDDNDPNVYYTIKIFQDTDGDKYPKDINQPVILKVGASGWNIPSGYIYSAGGMWNTSDCDDNNANIKGGTTYYVDADHDGIGSGTTFTICPAVGSAPYGYSNKTGDCDDSNAGIGNAITWYFDADNDGSPSANTIYGGGCARPNGAKLASELSNPNATDCDDNNPNNFPTNTWYQDLDNDGYSSGITRIFGYGCSYTGFKRAFELTGTSGDCNDNNAAFNPGAATAIWYQDTDGDGFGNPSVALTQCPTPAGYVANNTDCDDSNNKINPNAVWFKDADNDNLTDGTVLYQCARPANYKLSSELVQGASADCDDNNASTTSACVTGTYTSTIWVRDNDGDGYSPYSPVFYDANNRVSGVQCAPGCNWVCAQNCTGTSKIAKGFADCDDNNPNINTAITYYVDVDNDGYTSGATNLCATTPPNSTYKTAAQLQSGIDCNDNDANIKSGAISGNVYYRDVDGDGFGDPKVTTKDCSVPSGYVANGNDCNDALAAVHPNTIWYKDTDNDNYTDSVTFSGCVAPTGYKLNTALTNGTKDCNDANIAINPATKWYKDVDNDGFGEGTKVNACLQPANYKLAAELTDTISDCNDNDMAITGPNLWYKDADNDGYSDGITQTACTKPVNYKAITNLTSPNGDCDDSNPAIHLGSNVGLSLWYEDVDKDGFGNPNKSQAFCKPITGYVTNNLDCDDKNKDINPNTQWYKDADGDGYADGSNFITQCNKPIGYKLSKNLNSKIDTTTKTTSTNFGLALNFQQLGNNAVKIQDNNNTLDLQNEFTIEAWIKPIDDANNTIISKGDYKYLLSHNPNGKTGLGFYRNNGGWIYNDMNIPTEVWSHIAMTYSVSNNQIKFYLNGKQIGATLTGAITIANDNGDVSIGVQDPVSCNCNYFNGAMDEVRLWNQVRTEEEIANNFYSEINTVAPGLMVNYHFNQGVAGGYNADILAITDASGNNNWGAITSFTRFGVASNFINSHTYTHIDSTFVESIDTLNVSIDPSLGQALHFGTANYVNIPDLNNSLDLQNEFTIEAWINPADAANNTIIDKGDYKYLLSHNPNNTAGLGFYRGTWLYNPMTIPTNTWTHVAMTYSVGNNQIKFYQDGAQVGPTYTGAVTTANDNGAINIGRQNPSSCACNTFNGTMDEVRLWNKVRSAEEILANYNKEITTVMSGLVGNYHFNQGIAAGNNTAITSLSDESGKSNNGTLAGFTKTGATSNFVAPGAINKNYQTFGGDCNDNDPNQFKGQLWYKDADNDGYSEGSHYIGCKDSLGFKPAYALKALSGDCNDNNANEYPNLKWFKDTDGDGYTDGTSLVQCTKPVGYKSVNEIFKIDSITNTLTRDFKLALNFDGINDNIFRGAFNLNNNFTYETWFRYEKTGKAGYAFINGTGTGYGIYITADGKPSFFLTGSNGLEATNAMVDGNWYHFALTKGAANEGYKFYVNGKLESSTNNVATSATGFLVIGACCDGTQGNLKTTLDEFRVWNTTRTVEEINAFKNKELTGNEANLLAYYDFNQGTAGGNNTALTSVLDRSGKGNHLTFSSFALSTGLNSNFINNAPVNYTEKTLGNLDCNDNEATLHPNQLWYRDYDADNLGDPLVDSISCEKPIGYVVNNLDINDSTTNNTYPKLVMEGNGFNISNRDTVSSIFDNTFLANICQGSAPAVKAFVLKNTGTDTLNLKALKIIGDHAIHFSIIDTLNSFVKPNDSLVIHVRFTPDAIGVNKALLYVASNDASSPIFFFRLEGKVRGIDSTVINDTICAGNSYSFNGLNYTTSGLYFAQKTNLAGCDSTVVLNLLVIGSEVTSTLSGKVLNNQLPVLTGQVILYKILGSQISPVDTTDVNSGNYSFTNLEMGNYKIKYLCGVSCGLVPTYYDATYLYQLSKEIAVKGCPDLNIVDININAIALQSLHSGTGTINGTIKNGKTNQVRSKVIGNNAGIDVFLVDANNDLVGYTVTDANGDFTFNDIPDGDYRIIAELVGYKSDTTQSFTIGTLSSNISAAFCIDEVNKLIGPCQNITAVKPQDSEKLALRIYPNPSKGKFNIRTSVQQVGIKVYNGLGVEILSKTLLNDASEIDLSNYPTGFYILKVISEKEIKEYVLTLMSGL